MISQQLNDQITLIGADDDAGMETGAQVRTYTARHCTLRSA